MQRLRGAGECGLARNLKCLLVGGPAAAERRGGGGPEGARELDLL